MTQVNDGGSLLQVTDASFEREVLRAERPTVLTFWAAWNEPSASVIALLEDVAPVYAPDVVTALVSVDDAPMSSSHYALTTLPTVCIAHAGKIVETHAGLIDRVALQALMDRAAELKPEDR